MEGERQVRGEVEGSIILPRTSDFDDAVEDFLFSIGFAFPLSESRRIPFVAPFVDSFVFLLEKIISKEISFFK